MSDPNHKIKGAQILIPCEGSGYQPTGCRHIGYTYGVCAMCGGSYQLADGGVMPDHERDDIIARLDRGDFG